MTNPVPQPRPTRRPPWWVFVIVGVSLVIVLAAVFGSTSDNSGNDTTTKPEKHTSQPHKHESHTGSEQNPMSSHPAKYDVTLKSVTVTDDEFNSGYHSGEFLPKADLSYTNHSSKTSDYSVEVEFINSKTGDRIEVTYTGADKVAPGQTVDTKGSMEDAIGTDSVKADSPVTAKITDVVRTASY